MPNDITIMRTEEEDRGAPVSSLAENITRVKEQYGIGWATSMGDALDARKAAELQEQYNELAYLFMDVAANILWATEEEVPAKGPAIINAAQELATMIGNVPVEEAKMDEEPMEINEAKVDEAELEEVEEAEVAETRKVVLQEARPATIEEHANTGAILEAQSVTEGNRRGPLNIRTALIRAGAGNKRDRHWYPQETIEASADRFVGAKMYMTEHVQEEKGVRSEASVIQSIEGYDPAHGLIANVVAYDPDFCEKVRNMKDASIMNMLQCSLHAVGSVSTGEIEGEEYEIVQSIDEVGSVDWVTWAGAGGHAVEVSEVNESAEPMVEPVEEPIEEPFDGAPIIEEQHLPPAIKRTLLKANYENETELREAIGQMKEDLAALIPAARDNGGGGSVVTEPVTEAQVTERILAANRKHLGGGTR